MSIVTGFQGPLGGSRCRSRCHRDRPNMRRNDPLVIRVELHVQADTDPADLQATAAKARPTQARPSPFGEEGPALDEHLPPIRLKDCDLVDRVVSLHRQRQRQDTR